MTARTLPTLAAASLLLAFPSAQGAGEDDVSPSQPGAMKASAPVPPPTGQTGCSTLARLRLADTEITSATVQPAQLAIPGVSVSASDGSGVSVPVSGLPAFCRVEGRIHPEPGSDIRFEVWLPAEGWNGRYMGVGNGGFAGSIRYKDLADTARAGYATASTDTGHDEKATPQASWAPGNPAKLRDYGWRAVHLTTSNAKQLIAAYYGRPADKSYFQSCSNGGRQGLMEASRFPEDFDGILAGAPSAQMTTAVMAQVWSQQVQSRPGAAFRPEQMRFLQDEVLRQCDSRDGRKDGLIDDPRNCRVDVAMLSCAKSDSTQCFSAPQLNALRQLYAGPPKLNGRTVAFAFPPSGAELGRPVPFLGWDGFIAAGGARPPQQTMLAKGTIKDLMARPLTSIETFNWKTDPPKLTASLSEVIDARPNLARYFARGGKLIIYHGWADAAIPPGQTIAFHQAILKHSGPKAASSTRLFMIPGMQHCFGGTGAELFGEMRAADDEASPEDNISMALRQWVERGRVPDSVIGSSSPPQDQSEPYRKTRRLHCAFPKRSVLTKGADPDTAASYSCR